MCWIECWDLLRFFRRKDSQVQERYLAKIQKEADSRQKNREIAEREQRLADLIAEIERAIITNDHPPHH